MSSKTASILKNNFLKWWKTIKLFPKSGTKAISQNNNFLGQDDIESKACDLEAAGTRVTSGWK